jgi:polar amino acid transport system substrate-binding protein
LDVAGLCYHAAHDGVGRVKMAGPEFNRNDVGFLFQLGDPLRRRVNNAIVALREDGTYQKYYDKWFGSD